MRCTLAMLAAAALWVPVNSALLSEAARAAEPPPTVDLFPAVEAGQVTLKVTAKDSSQLTLQVKNNTDGMLRVRTPRAFTAVPVLAQVLDNGNGGGAPFGIGPNNQGGGGGNQALGGPFGQGNGNNNNGVFGQGPGGLPQGIGVFNVLPGKIVRKRLACVCLEFGKPDPHPRVPYRLQPVHRFTKSPVVAELLERLGRGNVPQSVAQLAAWHVSSGRTWSELSALTHKRANGRRVPRYTPAQLRAARRLAESLPAYGASPAKTLAKTAAASRLGSGSGSGNQATPDR